MNYKLILFNRIKSPAVLLKIILISIIFAIEISIEVDILRIFSINTIGKNDINIMLFISHIFTYLAVYADYLLIGFILLIPDIIQEPYLTNQIYLSCGSRRGLFSHLVKLILISSVAFVLWFVLLTIIITLFQIKIFDFTWPFELINTMYISRKLMLISIPISAMKYPLPMVSLLIILRSIVGFFILALASFYVAFKKRNVSYGIGLAVIIYVISDLFFLLGNVSFNFFGDPSKLFSFQHITYQYTLCAFFTFQDGNVDFVRTMINNFVCGAVMISILLILIRREITKKDLC